MHQTYGADGSTTGGTGVVATVGAPCTELGALACVGNRHKVTLVCGADLAWEVNETCSETEFCDTREGDTAGLCLEAIDACLTRQAGDPFCDGDTLMRCGPDGVTAEVETECAGVCENDACNDDKDQCPQVESEFADCELDCGGADACLPDEGCKYFAPSGFDINGPPTPVRLPAYSGLCDEECSSGRRGLAIQVSSSMGERVRATVGDPWLMVASQEHQLADACDIEEPGTPSCLIFERQAEIGSLYLHLFTEDSDAEPRNVSFELVDETAICP